jgi:hypothetical protein
MSEEQKTIVETVKETVVETAEKVVEAGKETVETVKDTVVETTEKVVETGKETVDTVKEKVEEVVDVVKAPARSKKATWWNRIWSAIVGAIVAVGAMFGITEPQIAEQKAKVEEIKTIATETLENIKAGKIEDAKAGLELIIESGKEVAEQAKTDVETVTEKVKSTPAEDIAAEAVKGAKENLSKTEQK